MGRYGFVQKVVGDLCSLDSSPIAKLLDSCVRLKSGIDTRHIHARIIKTQFSSEIFILGNAVILRTDAMYLIVCRKGTFSVIMRF